jgi:hypothetical protein
LKKLGAVAVIDPGGHRDHPAGPADSHKLSRGPCVVGREHRAERRDDAGKARIVERQLLGVGLDPLDLDARLGRPATRVLEKLRRHIRADHLGPTLRRRDRDVAAAASSDVQQHDARLDAHMIEDD